MPPEASTVAIVASLVLHVPPTLASFSAVVVPIHAFIVPVIAAGAAFTVIVTKALHPGMVV
jgi:hypothetical protein